MTGRTDRPSQRRPLAYQKRSEEEFAEEHRRRQEANFRRRARELGYEVRKIEGPSDEAAVSA
jgi:hypothetical protein